MLAINAILTMFRLNFTNTNKCELENAEFVSKTFNTNN